MRGISSGCCNRFGNINLNAALFVHCIMCQCCSAGVTLAASVATFADASASDNVNATVDECDCWVAFGFCDDDDMKPGGGSTPSAISSARCKRAFLSQSSIGNSSGLNLNCQFQNGLFEMVMDFQMNCV